MRRFILFAVALALAPIPVATGVANADERGEPISGLEITEAVVTPAEKGGTAIVGFRIENSSSRSVTLIGVRSERAGSAAIVVDSAAGAAEIATAILVGQDETLDLRSSHLRIELRDLAEAIRPGVLLPIELVFATGTVRVQAHAHDWTSWR